MRSTPVTLTTREAARDLTLADATASPCASCGETPCCSYLPLRTFEITNLMDLDYVRYILNFDGIVAGVASTGTWSAYLRRACRHLDEVSAACTIHDSDRQPSVCRHYNPYTCWYRPAMGLLPSSDFALVDRRRFEALAPLFRFDERRAATATPSWDALLELFAGLPVEVPASPPPAPDPVFARWEAEVLVGMPPAERATTVASDPQAHAPCDGCSAPCCTTLSFPLAMPATMSAVDFNRFSLGYPGVELGIGASEWVLAVKSSCRHLVDGRCGVYGQPERPLTCRYQDAHQCTVRVHHGLTRPPGHLRVRLEQLPWLEELIEVDDLGNVVALPTVDEARRHVEERWRAHGPVEVPVPFPRLAATGD